MKLTKNEIEKFAFIRGYDPSYSGRKGKFFFRKISWFKMDVHKLINVK